MLESKGCLQLKKTFWQDEETVLYQVNVNGICILRRKDNDMVNGTKLLKMANIPQNIRKQILSNEVAKVIVKCRNRDLRGVWITFHRARALSSQYNINVIVFPLLVDEPDQISVGRPNDAILSRDCHI